ncbi:MAG: T9SS type A sorting domain-containing protein [Bacteroidetes bacterium]|nr:T9SS type A sorting domain-containing protein [Bacteroidota bacterium]
MKKQLLILFLCLFAGVINAQRWTPVMLNDTFHYQKDGDAEISGSFFPVSYAASNGDTTFTFNKTGCINCLTFTSGPSCDSCYGLQNLPAVVAGYSIQKAVNGICTFTGSDTRILQTLAEVGDSWTFASTPAVTAQVISKTQTTILGQPDSVKTVLLSTGDTVVWSATHGIVQWPAAFASGQYYRLKGIENRNLGHQMLTMFDYYDFQTGDVFQYYGFSFEPGSGQLITAWSKYTVLQRQNYSDSIVYTYEVYHSSRSQQAAQMNIPPTYSNTYNPGFVNVITNCASHHLNQPNHSLIEPRFFNSYSYYPQRYWGCGDTMSGGGVNEWQYFHDSLNNPGAFFGEYSMSGGPVAWFPLSSTSDTLYGIEPFSQNIPQWPIFNMAIYARYVKGLGMIEANWDQLFEYSRYELLMGYVKNGDTVGTVYPDTYFNLSTPENQLLAVRSFPNPANESLRIELEQPSGTARIELLNLQGEVVEQFATTNTTHTLSTASIPSGTYLLRVSNDTGVRVQRVVIVH